MTAPNVIISFETIDPATYAGFKSLVEEQAHHHDCVFSGTDAAFLQALSAPDAVPKTLVMRDAGTNEAIGYLLFNHSYGFKGQEYYMEDLFVAVAHRDHGHGFSLMQALKSEARDNAIDHISWTVARNNAGAVGFYKNKMHASLVSHTIYDGSDLLSTPPALSSDHDVRKADSADLDLIESYVGQLKSLTPEVMENIRAAAAAPNAQVYIALSNDGTPKAVGIANANYSTFRTVYGQKLELMELVTSDVADASKSFEALTAYAVSDAKAIGHDGHFNVYAGSNSLAHRQFIQNMGLKPLQMTDDPASVFDVYGLDHQTIYAPTASNVVYISRKQSPSDPKNKMGGFGS